MNFLVFAMQRAGAAVEIGDLEGAAELHPFRSSRLNAGLMTKIFKDGWEIYMYGWSFVKFIFVCTLRKMRRAHRRKLGSSGEAHVRQAQKSDVHIGLAFSLGAGCGNGDCGF